MGQLIGDIVIASMPVILGIIGGRESAANRDFMRIPLPKSLHKMLVGYAVRVNTEQKHLEKYKPQGISLMGMFWYLYSIFSLIAWSIYLFRVGEVFGIDTWPLVVKSGWLFFIGGIGMVIHAKLYSIVYNSIKAPLTPDGKYRYNEKMRFYNGAETLKIHMRNTETKETFKIALPLPRKTVSSYRKLFGRVYTWWVVLKNTKLGSEYQYVATIGIWDLNHPNQLLVYAIDIKRLTAELVKNYIDEPENRV